LRKDVKVKKILSVFFVYFILLKLGIVLYIPCSLSDATIKKRVNGWVAEEANVKERLRLEIEKLKSDKKAEYKVISLVHVLKLYPCQLSLVAWCGRPV
jgi:hypothetical protein